MPCDLIADLDDIGNHSDPNRFNLLYPHWGYEMESNPREEIVALGDNLLKHADAVVGHHSHVPQAVGLSRIAGRQKIFVTSLGDFCSREKLSSYHYGVIMKITLGKSHDGA